ncbi:MAG: RHS repeat-associated core domain-containing protein [Thermoguttaceae bacterium]
MVREYTFDTAGRLAADTVTSLGVSGLVDGSVRRIGTTYDDLGRVQTVTSFSDTSGTTAVNQVQYVYNGWGKLAREYQEHDGAVDANTLHVDYDYADGASGGVARHVRLSQVTYPNSRQVQYGYGTTGAIDDIMSRLASIGDGTNTYAAYKYLGAGRIVTEDYEDVEVKLDYTPNDFAAFDRFGRILDQIWTDYGADPDVVLDHYSYTYDRAGNRTSRDNEMHSAFDEDYTYDRLDRLTAADRADNFDQSWGLDGLGNFSVFDDDGSVQTRGVNAANEITATSGIAAPQYDRAGNMIVLPKLSDQANTLGANYDAWNRLVEVTDGGILVAMFSYDGQGWRILNQSDSQSPGDPDGLDTYEHVFLSGQQVIETRQGSGVTATEAETLLPTYQQVWSPRYIDSLILRDENTDADGQCDDGRLFYLADANYNVTALVGEAEVEPGVFEWQVVERYLYSAYGEATVLAPDFTPDADGRSAFANTTLYTGRELDLSTGLMYYRARYYDSRLGTFVGRDPIKYRSGMNLYQYVASTPISHVDPSGMIYLGLPATPEKCAKAVFLMKYYALVRATGTYDNILLNHYMDSPGTPLVLSISAFDQWGGARSELLARIAAKASEMASGIPCPGSRTLIATESGSFTSITKMINVYTLTANFSLTVAKQKCRCGGCSTVMDVLVNFKATDRTDFNPGDAFGGPGITIADSLIIACNIGKPFDISASSTKTSSTVLEHCP